MLKMLVSSLGNTSSLRNTFFIERPGFPWSRLHNDYDPSMDIFLVFVAAYRKCPEDFPISRITSEETIMELPQIFNRFGVLEILVSDNATVLLQQKFQISVNIMAFKYVRTPPFHPQSNGQVERFVDTFKRVLYKLKGERTTTEIIGTFLAGYRAKPSPNTPNGNSPTEIMIIIKIQLHVGIMRPITHHSQ